MCFSFPEVIVDMFSSLEYQYMHRAVGAPSKWCLFVRCYSGLGLDADRSFHVQGLYTCTTYTAKLVVLEQTHWLC